MQPRSALSILLAYVFLVLLILLGTWALITQDWVRQQKIQETELSSLTRAMGEKLTHTISDTERSLLTLGKLLLNEQASTAAGALHAQAHSELQQNPQIARLSIWSAQGKERVALQQEALNTDLSSLPPSISRFRKNPALQWLIHPVVTAADGRAYLPVEFIQRKSRHEVQGYLSALLSINALDKYLRAICLSNEDSVSLLNAEGLLLSRLPLGNTSHSPDVRKFISHSQSQPKPDSPFRATYDTGDSNHMSVFMWLENRPLIIAASRPNSVASASFSAMKQRLLLGASALIVLLGMLAWLMHFDSRRHRAARIVLSQINASLEDRVSRRTAELEQSNREMIAFSYSISHDLRAPLRAINGFAHALKEDFNSRLDAQGNDYLDRICRASVRMGELIDELLSLANVSRAPLSIRELDLTLIANEIMEELRLANPERQIVFQAQANLKTEGDEALLRNALTNLIGNAWKFTRARRPAVISLSAEEDVEFTRFTLADNGIGFDMAHAKRLFQPFQQLHGDQGFGGTGIGLASVRRIIERHGGQICAEASPDEGARFIFTLPVRAQVIRRRRK